MVNTSQRSNQPAPLSKYRDLLIRAGRLKSRRTALFPDRRPIPGSFQHLPYFAMMPLIMMDASVARWRRRRRKMMRPASTIR
jgi:hypothetical protein